MLRIAQNLSLQQKMAPQLIQSLQLLQMSTLELELEIKQQLELNPLLEESLEQVEDQEEEQPEDLEAFIHNTSFVFGRDAEIVFPVSLAGDDWCPVSKQVSNGTHFSCRKMCQRHFLGAVVQGWNGRQKMSL